MVLKAASRVQHFVNIGKPQEIAWNLSHVDLILSAKVSLSEVKELIFEYIVGYK